MKFFTVELTTGNTIDTETNLYHSPSYYLTSSSSYPTGTDVRIIIYGARTSFDAKRFAGVTYRDSDKLVIACFSNPNTAIIVNCLALYK